MLDDDQRVLAFERQEQLGGALGLLVGHAGHRLVEQQQLGVLHQQHADLEPLLLAVAQQAGGAPRLVLQVDQRQHLADAVELLAAQAVEQRGAHAAVGLQRELEVLEHGQLLVDRRLLELAADAGLRDLRLGQAQQVDVAAERDAAAVGPRLAGDAVHHRRLAGAVGADDAAQLADVDRQRQLVQRLEAVEADADVVDVQRHALAEIDLARGERCCARPAAPGARRCAARLLPSGRASSPTPLKFLSASARPGPAPAQQADHAVRQEQRHRDEQRAQEEQPELGEGDGEPALGAVDEEGADDRADQRRAAADRGPDRDLDAGRRAHLAGVDDADLRHVQRAGDAAHHRAQRPDAQLVGHAGCSR